MQFKIGGLDTDGKQPFAEAFDQFQQTSQKLFDKTTAWVESLKDSNSHVMPHVEALGQKLYCLRVRQGNNQARLFFTITKGKIVLLNGYCKKSTKIPDQELKRARLLCQIAQSQLKGGKNE